MTTRGTRRTTWAWDGAAAVLVTAGIMTAILAGGGIWAHVGGGDLHGWFLPRYVEAARAIVREGRLPLWNPWEFCGAPLLAQAQGSIYPPVPLLFAWLAPYWALQALIAANVLALAWGLVAYLRAHALPRWTGALATLVTVAGVYATPSGVGIDHPDFLASLAWVPWVLLGCERAIDRGARPWLAPFALAVALVWLGGYPDFGLDGAVLLGAMTLVAGRPPLARRLAIAAGGYALGTVIAAVQLAPLAEAVGQSVRTEHASQFWFTRAFMAYGRTGLWRAVAWGPLGPGLAAWGLVLVALAGRERRRLAWAVALLWCLFALDPPLDLLYRLPPFRSSRYPHGWSNLLPLFVGLLVAAGAGTALRLRERAVRLAVLALALATGVRAARTIAAAPTRLGLEPPDHALVAQRVAVLRRAVAALPDAPRVSSPPEQNAGAYLAHRLASPAGYDPSMPPRRVRRLIDTVNAGTRAQGMTLHVARAPRLAALLGVGIVTAPRGPLEGRYRALGFRPVASLPPHDAVLYRPPVPRVRLAARVAPVPDEDAALARLADPAHDPARAVILFDAEARTVGALGPPAPGDRAEIVHEAPERLVLRTQTRAPALVAVTDAAYPGWVATIDGRPAPILTADVAFRAIAVPAGAHEVTMRYAPRSLRLGVAGTLAGLALAAALAWPRRRGRARG